MYVPKGEDDATGVLEAAFVATIACEPIDREAARGGAEGQDRASGSIRLTRKDLTAEELAQWQRKEALRKQVIKVDDFPQDFGRAEIVAEAGGRETRRS